jgi:FkbM family methyltransferase
VRRHPIWEALAKVATLPPCRSASRKLLRNLLHSPSLSLKRKQQAFNLLATKASSGVTSIEANEVVQGNGHPLRISLNLQEDLDRKWYYWGYAGYEAECVNAVWELAKTRKYTTILEVGANIGFFSLLLGVAARSNSQTSAVHVFEPFEPVYKTLAKNIELNPGLGIRSHRVAVCDKIGNVMLHLPEDPTAKTNASLVEGLFKQAGGVTVPATTLDNFVETEQLNHVDLIKLDCEGAEPFVLAGAKSVIARDQPDILMEVLPPYAATLQDSFESTNYLFYHVTDDGLVPRKALVADTAFRDYLITTRPWMAGKGNG